MANVDMEKLIAVRDSAHIDALLPYLRVELERLEAGVEARAASALAAGTLEPQLAVNLWVEKLSYRKLMRNLEARVKVGHAAGTAVGPDMVLQKV